MSKKIELMELMVDIEWRIKGITTRIIATEKAILGDIHYDSMSVGQKNLVYRCEELKDRKEELEEIVNRINEIIFKPKGGDLK